MHETRLRRIREKMDELGLDALLVTKEVNSLYLCGFGEDSRLLVTGSDAVLITDSRYTEEAEAKVRGASVHTFKSDMLEELAVLLGERGVKTLGFEARSVTVAALGEMEKKLSGTALKPTDGLVEELRIVKDAAEVERMREAIAVADAALADALPYLMPGVTEADMAAELRYRLFKRGASEVSFPPIIGFGPTSSLPHAKPGSRRLGEDDNVQFDWGAVVNHYCSDCSRVFFIGEPDEEILRIHEIVSEADRRAREGVRPGVSLKEIDVLARSFIEREGYGQYFGHGLGHGVGLEVHEAPRVSPKSADTAREGMVFTIEAGIYLPGKGGVRVEDMVLVTADGCEVLTRFPYDTTPNKAFKE